MAAPLRRLETDVSSIGYSKEAPFAGSQKRTWTKSNIADAHARVTAEVAGNAPPRPKEIDNIQTCRYSLRRGWRVGGGKGKMIACATYGPRVTRLLLPYYHPLRPCFFFRTYLTGQLTYPFIDLIAIFLCFGAVAYGCESPSRLYQGDGFLSY